MRTAPGRTDLDRFASYEAKCTEVLRVLAACGGDVEAAAAQLGCLPSTVRGIARDHDHRVPSKAEARD